MNLNTKQDVLNMLVVNPERTKRFLRGLLDNRYLWCVVAEILPPEVGIQDDTHRVVRDSGSLIQQEREEDPNSKLFRLGFSVEEAEDICNG